MKLEKTDNAFGAISVKCKTLKKLHNSIADNSFSGSHFVSNPRKDTF